MNIDKNRSSAYAFRLINYLISSLSLAFCSNLRRRATFLFVSGAVESTFILFLFFLSPTWEFIILLNLWIERLMASTNMWQVLRRLKELWCALLSIFRLRYRGKIYACIRALKVSDSFLACWFILNWSLKYLAAQVTQVFSSNYFNLLWRRDSLNLHIDNFNKNCPSNIAAIPFQKLYNLFQLTK